MTQEGLMNILVRLVVGAITGILTGKALEIEGRLKVVQEGRVGDVICGIVGAVAGEWLFFWVVTGPGDRFSEFATAVLGAITLVGAGRLLTSGKRLARSY
jgi:uncharacterized membrane protein YeaQ/YmgE (transglycosylase-associated protein family)